MNPKERAEQLRQEAIKTLLEERNAIDAQLKSLGYGQEIRSAPTGRRRGRPPKTGTVETGPVTQGGDPEPSQQADLPSNGPASR